MQVAVNETTNNSQGISIERSLLPPSGPIANLTNISALPSEEISGSSGSGFASDGLFPVLVAIVPLAAVAFFIMAAVFLVDAQTPEALGA